MSLALVIAFPWMDRRKNRWLFALFASVFICELGYFLTSISKTLGGALTAYRVSGEAFQVVDIPPGYTHNIENTGDVDMVTLMWANEVFDSNHPDTFRLPVEPAKEENKR